MPAMSRRNAALPIWIRVLIHAQELTIVGPSLGGMASFSEATCAAGVLLWRPPFANDTNGPDDLFVGLSAMGLQLRQFNVSVWQLDEGHVPQVSRLLMLLPT